MSMGITKRPMRIRWIDKFLLRCNAARMNYQAECLANLLDIVSVISHCIAICRQALSQLSGQRCSIYAVAPWNLSG